MKTKKFNMVPTMILCLLVNVILLLENSGLASASIQCQDNAGSPVDWFIIYKMPVLSGDYPSSFKCGKGFYYMDEHQTSWYTERTFDVGCKSALKATLDQIYTQDIMYIMYNDQFQNVINKQKRAGKVDKTKKIQKTKIRVKAHGKGTNKKSKKEKALSRQHGAKSKPSPMGHLKGTLGFDDKTGFWLIHSAPKFPPKKGSGFSWADNASDNGQMFLCVSFSTKSLNDIAKQLFTMQPKIYDHVVSSNFKNKYPELQRVLNKEKPTTESIVNLSSLGSLQLKSFAKHGAYGKDLYECLVAPELKTDMNVETWQRKDPLPNSCSKTTQYKIYNIQEINMPPIHPGGPNVTFKETKDHSKFAVSRTTGPWVCIGDINREKSQFERGGGTLCLKNKMIADAFRGVVHTGPSAKAG